MVREKKQYIVPVFVTIEAKNREEAVRDVIDYVTTAIGWVEREAVLGVSVETLAIRGEG